MSDPRPEDKIPLDRLATAVVDTCRAMWTIYHLRGWGDVARAPSEAIKEALDTAYRLGRLAEACERDADDEDPAP